MSRWRRQQRKRMGRRRRFERACEAFAEWATPRLIELWNKPSPLLALLGAPTR